MISFLADENFSAQIVRGVLRRSEKVDLVRVQDVGLSGSDDITVLEWAAQAGRVLLTHDLRTIPHYAYQRVRDGKAMPGVFEVTLHASLLQVIEDIMVLATCSDATEWEGQVRYLPLK